MRTIPTDQAHRTLITKHETMRWVSDIGSLSIRKTAGRYIVRLEDFENKSITVKSFATLAGAQVCADNLRSFYL